MNEKGLVSFDAYGFELKSLDTRADSLKGFQKLSLNPEQRKQMGALIQYIPSVVATGTIAESYILKFPDGISHTLTRLEQGGVMSMYQDSSGKFAGTASLYSASGRAIILGAFTIMAAVSGQYYLGQINKDLKMIRMNIDKILEFLYGDKKAELMAEANFVKYSYENYSSIMLHNDQRIATIGSLQNSKKVAMKDIEFYINDLDSTVKTKDSIESLVNKAFQIKESLELSMQLYGISSVLEIYYAQNCDIEYITYLENEIVSYIDKCEKRMLSSFSILSKFISDYRGKPLTKIDKSSYEKAVGDIVDLLNSGEESSIKKSFRMVLHAVSENTEYHITKDGDVYLKVV